jgi:hypothetical protein
MRRITCAKARINALTTGSDSELDVRGSNGLSQQQRRKRALERADLKPTLKLDTGMGVNANDLHADFDLSCPTERDDGLASSVNVTSHRFDIVSGFGCV